MGNGEIYIVNDNRFWENGYGILDNGQESDWEKKSTLAEYIPPKNKNFTQTLPEYRSIDNYSISILPTVVPDLSNQNNNNDDMDMDNDIELLLRTEPNLSMNFDNDKDDLKTVQSQLPNLDKQFSDIQTVLPRLNKEFNDKNNKTKIPQLPNKNAPIDPSTLPSLLSTGNGLPTAKNTNIHTKISTKNSW